MSNILVAVAKFQFHFPTKKPPNQNDPSCSVTTDTLETALVYTTFRFYIFRSFWFLKVARDSTDRYPHLEKFAGTWIFIRWGSIDRRTWFVDRLCCFAHTKVIEIRISKSYCKFFGPKSLANKASDCQTIRMSSVKIPHCMNNQTTLKC